MNDTLIPPASASLCESVIMEHAEAVSYRGRECSLSLTTRHLSISDDRNGSTKLIHLDDVVGATSRATGKKGARALEIHTFAHIDNTGCFSCCCGSKGRKRVTEIIFFQDEAECFNWVNGINCVLSGVEIRRASGNTIIPPPQRKFLVVVNPVGGTGNATRIWEEETQPFLAEAGINYELVITQRANHAKDLISTKDLHGIETIVIVGGDGLIFEVVSGLISRDDKDEIMKEISLAPIPGGSGNGLAKSILFECNESYSASSAAFLAARGVASPLDLSRVHTLSHYHNAFLILGWGLISDVDILSESMRWMGEVRFHLSAVYRLLLKQLYRGRLSLYTVPQIPLQSHNEEGSNKCSHPIPTLPSINEPLDTSSDSSWLVIEDDFVLVWIMQTSHCSATIYSAPGAATDDGVFTIIVVRDISRCRLLSFLLDIDSGKHMDDPKLEVYKATAYRLEPLTDKGIFTLDGEVVEYGPIQGVVEPSAIRIKKLKY